MKPQSPADALREAFPEVAQYDDCAVFCPQIETPAEEVREAWMALFDEAVAEAKARKGDE